MLTRTEEAISISAEKQVQVKTGKCPWVVASWKLDGAGVFTLAKQALYHLSHSTGLELLS
jgi:hypothetical protein